MTPREKDLAVWEETCIEFIQRATTLDELHAVGLEIGESKTLIEANKSDIGKIHSTYLIHKRNLSDANAT